MGAVLFVLLQLTALPIWLIYRALRRRLVHNRNQWLSLSGSAPENLARRSISTWSMLELENSRQVCGSAAKD
jgi:hypothetical protein